MSGSKVVQLRSQFDLGEIRRRWAQRDGEDYRDVQLLISEIITLTRSLRETKRELANAKAKRT